MLALYLFVWSLVASVLLSTYLTPVDAKSINITLPITSPEITYSPFLCNATNPSGTFAGACTGAWTILNVSNSPVVSTNGPDPGTGNVIPQMFLSIRAHDVFVKLSSSSNANANLTVSTPSGTSISLLLNSTLAEAGVVDLIDSVATLAITFIPDVNSSTLIIESIVITVDDTAAPSSYLPSQSLPMSVQPFTYTPTSTGTSNPTTPASHQSSVSLRLIQGFSLVLGIGLGLSCITAAGLIYWRRKRMNTIKQTEVDVRW